MLINEFEKLTLNKFKIKDIVPNATILLLGRRRSGKCLLKGEKVLMYDGSIKNIEDIIIGDIVMGDDSTPRNVLEIHSGIDTMYKVTHKNGESYTVNSNHILSLIYDETVVTEGRSLHAKNIRDNTNEHNYKVTWFDKYKYKLVYKTFSYKNKNKEDIYEEAKKFLDKLMDDRKIDIAIKDFLKLSKKYRDNLLGYQVPIEFPKKELPIDPYMIGQWLANSVSDKQIPINYKCNSRTNRLRLLAGLIDADGYLNKRNDFEFIYIDNIQHSKLIQDILYLARSLGFSTVKQIMKRGFVRIRISGNGIQEIPTNRIRIKSMPLTDPFPQSNHTILSKISVEEVGEDEYYGIELDGNNRYVLGNFIVTHNSWLVRDIFYHHRDIPRGIIFSGTENANPFFGDFVPDSFIHSEYDPELIETVLVNQGKKVREARQKGLSKDGLLRSNRFFIVLDDMLADANAWKKEKTIQEIFFNGRHFNIFFILTMQYPLGIPPALRSNIDYVFIFNEPSIKNRKKIYDDYGGPIASFDHFQNILDSCTANHECLVIKTASNSTDIKDQVFWYKASEHSNFKVGHPSIWKYHDNRYNSNYTNERDKDKEAVDKLRIKYAKTKKLKIIVSRQGDVVDYEEENDSN